MKPELAAETANTQAHRPSAPAQSPLDVSVYIGGMVVQQALTLGSGVLVAHALGPAAFGITSITRNLFALALIMAPLGLDLALLRHINERAKVDSALMAEIALMRRIVAGIALLVFALVAVALGPWLEAEIYATPRFGHYLLLAFIAFPFAADTALMAASFRGLHRPIFGSIANLYVQPIVRIVFLLGFLLAGFGLSGVILATSCGAIASSLLLSVSFARLKRHVPQAPDIGHTQERAQTSANVAKVMRYSTWLAATLLMAGVLRGVDVLVLGYFRPAYEVGSYAAIASIAQIIMICPQAAGQNLGARIARHFHSGNPAGMKADLQQYLRVAGLMTAPLFGGVAAFGPWLSLVFGTRFTFTPSLCLNLAVVYYISAIFAPFGYALSMTGAHKKELAILGGGALASFLLCGLLAPLYGGNGVALAITMGYLGMTLVRTALVARRSNFRVGHWADALPPLACLALGLLVRQSHDLGFAALGWGNALPFLLAYGALVAALYAAWILKAEEKQTVRRWLGKLPLFSRARPARAKPAQRIFVLSPHYVEYNARLALGLAANAHVTLFAQTQGADRELTNALRGELAQIPHSYAPTGKRHWDLLFFAKAVAKVLRFRPSSILAPEMGHWYYTPLLKVLARLAPISLIVHDPAPHSGADAEHAARIAGRIKAERALASHFVVHGAVCKAMLRANTQIGLRPIASILHGPILFPSGDPQPPQRLPAQILLFGRMQAYKGLAPLIEACDRMAQEVEQIELVLAGRGPELTRLSEMIAQRRYITVKSGFVQPEEVIAMLRETTILVAPYLDATQSGVIAAGLANHTPIVASNVGSIPDLVIEGAHGMLVPPADVPALYAALKAMLARQANPAQRAATYTLPQGFDWITIGAQILALDAPATPVPSFDEAYDDAA